ncbi:hypothetical protein M1D80_12995 [Phyllobacteriaceae bacterium JZ32]
MAKIAPSRCNRLLKVSDGSPVASVLRFMARHRLSRRDVAEFSGREDMHVDQELPPAADPGNRKPSSNRMADDLTVAIRTYLFFGIPTKRQPVSLVRAVQYIRRKLPECELCDAELETLIARHAIAAGYMIHFDGGPPRPM